jgi:hypothetical protein
MPNCVIKENNSVALPARELNFHEFKPEGLHEKHAVAT